MFHQECLTQGAPPVFNEDNVTNAIVEYDQHKLSIQQLDWRFYEKDNFPSYDIIVASDIVFAKELHESLASLLKDLLEKCNGEDPSAFIACTVRADGMVHSFIQVNRGRPIGLRWDR